MLNSRITRRIMLQNLGDMPSNFSVQGGFAPDFSVSPREGEPLYLPYTSPISPLHLPYISRLQRQPARG